MEPLADLQTYAEVAITLAGLTGIIGAIQRRQKGGLSDREKLHILSLLNCSLMVIFLAFIPALLSRWPDSNAELWNWIIRVLFVTHVVAGLVLGYASRSGKVFFEKLTGIEKILAVAFTTFAIFAIAAEFLMVLGMGTKYAPFLFEIVLLVVLAAGLFNFVSLLLGENGAEST